MHLSCDDHIRPHPSNEQGRTTRNRSVFVQNTELASVTPIKPSPAIGAPPIMRIFRLDTDEATSGLLVRPAPVELPLLQIFISWSSRRGRSCDYR
jgi:hypothetical protein